MTRPAWTASQAAELAATQRPIAASALTEVSGPPAWASIPSWAVIGTADHAIPPAAQEFMADRAHSSVTKIPFEYDFQGIVGLTGLLSPDTQ